jgi:hypothetical protein
MKLWADFFDFVLPMLPGVPQDLATLHIRSAAIDFLAETGVYQETLPPIDVVYGEPEFTLEAPDGFAMVRVMQMYCSGKEMNPDYEDRLASLGWDWRDQEGTPAAYIQYSSERVRLVPIPDRNIDNGISVKVALKPSRLGTGIPDYVFEDYVEIIAAGAISSLAAIPAKPWTSADVETKYGAKFSKGKRDTKIEVNKSFTRASLRVKLRRIH